MEALLLQTRRAPARHHNAKIQTILSSSFFIQLRPSEMEVLKKGSFYMHLQGPRYSCRNTASIQLKTTLERINESIKQVIMNKRSTQGCDYVGDVAQADSQILLEWQWNSDISVCRMAGLEVKRRPGIWASTVVVKRGAGRTLTLPGPR